MILGVDMTRCLGLDFGDKRIGVALSDAEGILASPLTIIDIRSRKTIIEAIVDIVEKNQVGKIIIGLPRMMDGIIGEQAKKTQVFAEELICHIEVPVEFRDERLSTVSAKRMMQSVRKAGKVRHDSIAAALILQSYLDESRWEYDGSDPLPG